MLEIFPERLLDGSIHTAVLVGIVTLWLAAESMGWVFAGFVVPGYLAALGVVAPMSLLAILVEAVLTYALGWFAGAALPRWGLWSRAFGRERFLLFILASVPVRLFVEGLAAPQLEALLQPLSADPAWQGARFYGVGVVLVPLTANALWKLGLARGLAQVGAVSLATWAVLTQVLVRFTNFGFGGFEQTFEDLATDFLAVPKVTILLVTTALVAARNNSRFGWDYGGIIAPSLLAIITVRPAKLATTLVEIVVLVLLYRLLTALPGVRRLNLGGPRRIASMYALSYVLKWVVAALAQALAIKVRVSDLFGFGYLLTALVASKAVQKGHVGRTLGPLCWTAGQGVALGLAASLLLSWALPARDPTAQPATAAFHETSMARSILLAQASVRTSWPPTSSREVAFREFTRTLEALVREGNAEAFDVAFQDLRAGTSALDWATRADGRRCLGVRAARGGAAEPSGVPSAWWCGGDGPALYVPQPLGDPDSLWVAAWLAHTSDVALVVIDGVDDAPTRLLGGAEANARQAWRWARVRGIVGDRTVLVLRTVPEGASWLDPRSAATTAGIAHRLGPLSKVALRFEEGHGDLEALWDDLREIDGMLTVSVAEVGAVMEEAVPLPPGAEPGEARDARAPLLSDLTTIFDEVARRPDAVGTPAERLATVRVVLGTALRLARGSASGPPGAVQWVAQSMGVEASWARDEQGRPAWLLAETSDGPPGWGTWVIRPGPAASWVVAVPWSAEEPGTSRVGRAFFDELDARALWVSRHGSRFGAPSATDDLSGALELEPLALLTALSPPWEPDGDAPRLVLVRRQPYAGWSTDPVVLSRGIEFVLPAERASAAALGPALRHWPGTGFDDGRPSTASLNAYGLAPVRYLNALAPDRAFVVWLGAEVLGEVSGTADHDARVAWYAEQGVPVLSAEEAAPLLAPYRGGPAVGDSAGALRRHAETLSLDALVAARRDGEVAVLDEGLRLVLLSRQADRLCASTAGAAGEIFPLNGCWGVAP